MSVLRVLVLLVLSLTGTQAWWKRDSSNAMQPEVPPGASVAPARVTLTPEQRSEIAKKKATCPFIGSLVAEGLIPIYGSVDSPLAKVEDVMKQGNSGGKDLGKLLAMFATGNHAFEKASASATTLNKKVPLGYFSLDFPGSQGSHHGHSGILEGDPETLNSGRFSEENFDRLLALATTVNGKKYLKVSAFGAYIAENLHRDPQAKVVNAGGIAKDTLSLFSTLLPAIKSHLDDNSLRFTEEARDSVISLTKTLGANNLIGSSGEFGLLMALLSHSPASIQADGELAVSVEEVTMMFKEHRFPAGWHSWPKRILDWIRHTSKLTFQAHKHY